MVSVPVRELSLIPFSLQLHSTPPDAALSGVTVAVSLMESPAGTEAVSGELASRRLPETATGGIVEEKTPEQDKSREVADHV